MFPLYKNRHKSYLCKITFIGHSNVEHKYGVRKVIGEKTEGELPTKVLHEWDFWRDETILHGTLSGDT